MTLHICMSLHMAVAEGEYFLSKLKCVKSDSVQQNFLDPLTLMPIENDPPPYNFFLGGWTNYLLECFH